MPAKASTRLGLAHALRDAAITGLIAFGLLLPLIGFNTVQNIHNELILETRWPLLATLVAVIAAGRFAYSLLIAAWGDRPISGPRRARKLTGWVSHLTSRITPVVLAFAILYPALALWLTGSQGAVKWIDNFGVQVLIYVMLGWGLNIVVGLAGLLDLGYVAFYAVGAYAYALLATTFGLSFWILLPVAGCAAAFWGIMLGFPVLRLRGDYLAIVTLAFGEIVRLVLINWVAVTNGYAGISSIPRPTFFGIPFNATDEGFAARFGLEFSSIYRILFLYYLILESGLDYRCHDGAVAAASARQSVGGLAGGRDRVPLARHQYDQHQAHRVRHGGDVRRFCRLVLRLSPGFHLPREFHVHGIGGDSGNRGAGGYGESVGSCNCGRAHDRRNRDHA